MSPSLAATILRITSIGMILFALLWATAPYTAMNAPAVLIMDVLDWPMDGSADAMTRSEMWLSSVGAGLIAGFATLFLLVACPQIEQGNMTAARNALIAILAWFFIDFSGSIASGVTSNAVWSIFFALPFVVTLLLLLRSGTSGAES